MKKTGLFQFVLILVGAILLVACGQAASPGVIPGAQVLAPIPTETPKPADAGSLSLPTGNCTLLSKDEIGTVLGETVVEVRDEAKNTICAFQTANLILEMNFLNTGAMTGEQYMQNIRSINENGVSITGLGDDAFNKASPVYPILIVRKGNSVYSFGLRNVTADQSLSSPDNAQELEKAIAELLLSRLP
jgi:hypothetical protein